MQTIFSTKINEPSNRESNMQNLKHILLSERNQPEWLYNAIQLQLYNILKNAKQ